MKWIDPPNGSVPGSGFKVYPPLAAPEAAKVHRLQMMDSGYLILDAGHSMKKMI